MPDEIDAANAELELSRSEVEPDVIPVSKPREEPKRSKITYLPDVHRKLPQSEDAEKGVISSFFLSPKECGSIFVQRRTKPDAFHIPAHATIFGVMLELWNAGEPIDFITVAQKLRDRGELDRCGGAPAISDLFHFMPTAANLLHYLEIVEEKATLRRVILTGTEWVSRAYDEQDNVPEVVEGFERDVMSIRRTQDRGGMTAKEVAALGINELQRIIDLGGKIGGLSTGFPNLDKATDGLNSSKVYGICGHSGTGKSSLALQILEHVAIHEGVATAVWPLEPGILQLAKRQIASRARVNTVNWRNGARPSEQDQEALAQAAADLSRMKMYFEPASDCTIQQVRTRCRHLVAMHGVKVALIDSLSVLHSDSRQASGNRTREVAEAAEGLKDMAKELDIVVMVIVHIDRLQKRNERPQRWHVAESAQVERAFDDLWMIYEPGWSEDAEPELYPEMGLYIPKQRDGEERIERRFIFEKPFTRFREVRMESESQGDMMI